jgi:carbon-monoxide dehydrogenase large subunit
MAPLASLAGSRQWDPRKTVTRLAKFGTVQVACGAMASRSTVTLSAAIHYASVPLREKVFAIAANMLECSPGDLELRDGGVGLVGVPGVSVSLAKVAAAARPGWDHGRPDGIDAGLESTYYFVPETVTWSYASHVAIVDVDTETGGVKIEQYAIAHDCGTVVNPMLVDGQVVGGAVGNGRRCSRSRSHGET